MATIEDGERDRLRHQAVRRRLVGLQRDLRQRQPVDRPGSQQRQRPGEREPRSRLGPAVQSVRSWINYDSWQGDISARRAIDAEEDYGPPGEAYAWWLSFRSASDSGIYDFGDARGCPSTGLGSNCGGGWTRQDIWNVAQSAATPQIYNTSGVQAQQSYGNSRWALENVSDSIFFRSSLSQNAACDQNPGECPGLDNTPQQTYAQLCAA